MITASEVSKKPGAVQTDLLGATFVVPEVKQVAHLVPLCG